jgi:hypothetical protein
MNLETASFVLEKLFVLPTPFKTSLDDVTGVSYAVANLRGFGYESEVSIVRLASLGEDEFGLRVSSETRWLSLFSFEADKLEDFFSFQKANLAVEGLHLKRQPVAVMTETFVVSDVIFGLMTDREMVFDRMSHILEKVKIIENTVESIFDFKFEGI